MRKLFTIVILLASALLFGQTADFLFPTDVPGLRVSWRANPEADSVLFYIVYVDETWTTTADTSMDFERAYFNDTFTISVSATNRIGEGDRTPSATVAFVDTVLPPIESDIPFTHDAGDIVWGLGNRTYKGIGVVQLLETGSLALWGHLVQDGMKEAGISTVKDFGEGGTFTCTLHGAATTFLSISIGGNKHTMSMTTDHIDRSIQVQAGPGEQRIVILVRDGRAFINWYRIRELGGLSLPGMPSGMTIEVIQ